jgi:hypothetical protein
MRVVEGVVEVVMRIPAGMEFVVVHFVMFGVVMMCGD